ncbi:hypothetical protein HBI56_216160 [Parastagonospora nodorum]|uniref:Peptidase A1 domain-containing protein n=1 Tax=Phaeosphaeria nodorum (strain SN15 / ATCC MYA-4574 / FGSC 10173) TaxID=321614 RepID=A0A7U2F0F4_PHANO|nr:hypothetical protein HBH56_176300 [Parastagonospora nodorum]QRC96201.1 hypothetical protein JI435_011610 [Parastagonospora nodorum SN15]KAH3926312.1 hypothetical protein HBH54_166860 [Parastagonospora nodorum]KAH3939149.1 hypothetical protein HBH53_240060 [Parastagonospora nodorum]KAH3965557.1 hypothetical protein HBH52_203500 [Parastagonospora nodorum]
MLRLLLLASVARASLYDAQQPLRGSNLDVVVPIKLDENLQYSYPLKSGKSELIALDTLQEVAHLEATTPFSSITINVPLDLKTSGSVTFSHNASSESDQVDDKIWLHTSVLATTIPLDHIGIRKGGMITMSANSVWLSLDTPYISLPDSIFNVLLQAANTSSEQDFVLDCDTVPRLPDLVFGLDIDHSWTLAGDEVVVRPEQYVMETEAGKCVLLARRRRGLQRLGWAAIRGREFVIDLAGQKMGFES